MIKQILRALGASIVYIFVNHKIFAGMLFVLTAGQEFPLPEWVLTTLGLIMMFTVIIWFLGQR